MSKEIPLTKGAAAIVDDEDYERLVQWKWYLGSGGYPHRRVGGRAEGKAVPMHNFILQVPPGRVTDHVNGDRLDNRRCNLRIATNQQNAANSQKPQRKKPTSSRFKGVRWHKTINKWVAQIRVNYRAIYLGSFVDEVEAAHAYDAAAREAFGSFARTNFA